LHIAADDDSGGATEALAGVAADRRTAVDIECSGEDYLGQGQCGLDQGLAHPAPGAGNGEPDCVHGQGVGGADGSPILLNQSMTLPTNPASSP
jgi:hypothetical protein